MSKVRENTVSSKVLKLLLERVISICVSNVILTAQLVRVLKMVSVLDVKMDISCRAVHVSITAPISNIQTWS